MEQKDVSLKPHIPIQLDIVMYKKGLYKETDEKSIGEVCRQNKVDAYTFLTVVNFLTEEIQSVTEEICHRISLETLMLYLHNAHDYFLDFRLPHIRRKLVDAISTCQPDVAFVIRNFFDEYASEVDKHMMYEEKVAFPYVRDLLNGKQDGKYNISVFSRRHEQIEKKLSDLKNILIKYYPGSGSYLLNSVLFDLFTTEEDLISHTRIEDKLFIPTVLDYEKRLLKND